MIEPCAVGGVIVMVPAFAATANVSRIVDLIHLKIVFVSLASAA